MSTESTRTPREPKPVVPLPDGADCLLSKDQVVASLGWVSERHFWRMVSSGSFPRPCTRAVGKPRWRLSVVRAWIASACGTGDTDAGSVQAPQRPRKRVGG